jgi:oxygen-dependent protoporphyrinogen oxidase
MLFETRERRKDVMRSFTIAGGLQAVIDSIAAEPNITVQTRAEAAASEQEPGGIKVSVAGGFSYGARAVALAGPSVARLVALPICAASLRNLVRKTG